MHAAMVDNISRVGNVFRAYSACCHSVSRRLPNRHQCRSNYSETGVVYSSSYTGLNGSNSVPCFDYSSSYTGLNGTENGLCLTTNYNETSSSNTLNKVDHTGMDSISASNGNTLLHLFNRHSPRLTSPSSFPINIYLKHRQVQLYRRSHVIPGISRGFSSQPSDFMQSDQDFTQWKRRIVGAQPYQNLKVGPYKRGKWFVSYKDDPGSFITNILILLVTGYSIFTMMPGESMSVRRQRRLRQLLLDNAEMTEADLLYIENYKLPDDVTSKEDSATADTN